MKKQILFPVLFVATLLTTSLAYAGPGYGPGFGPRGGGMFGPGQCARGQGPMNYEQHNERLKYRLQTMATVLDLSDDQQAQIKALFDQQWEKRQQQWKQMQTARDEMRAAMTAENFDEAAFRAKVAKQAELRADRMVERIQLQEKINALLTPEQKEKADKLNCFGGPQMNNFGRRGPGMGPRGGMMGGSL